MIEFSTIGAYIDSDADELAPVLAGNSLVTIDNVSVNLTAADGFPVSNVANDAQFLKWKAGTADVQMILTVDTGGEEVDFIAIAGHNIGTLERDTIFQGDTGSGTFTSIRGILPLDSDAPFILCFKRQALDQIRLIIRAGSGVPEVGVLMVGRRVECERRVYVGHSPIILNRRQIVSNGRSENGAFLGRIVIGERLETELSLENLTPSFYRDELEPFFVSARERAFFFAWRPETYDEEVVFGWLNGDPSPTNTLPNGMMSVALQIGGTDT